jgi:hypothetical protein
MTTTRLPSPVSSRSASLRPMRMPSSSGPVRLRPSFTASAMKDSPSSRAGSMPTRVTPAVSRSLITTEGTRTRVAHAATVLPSRSARSASSGGAIVRSTEGSSR